MTLTLGEIARRLGGRLEGAPEATEIRAVAGLRECFARVPAAQRTLVSDHDAFGYFAHRYGIAIVGAG